MILYPTSSLLTRIYIITSTSQNFNFENGKLEHFAIDVELKAQTKDNWEFLQLHPYWDFKKS